LPEVRRNRYKTDFGIKDEDIESYINDFELGAWFEKVAEILKDKPARSAFSTADAGGDKIKTASNYITSDLVGLLKNSPLPNPLLSKERAKGEVPSAQNFAELINMLSENKISSRVAKDILAMIVLNDESPMKIATEKDLIQKNDESAIKSIVEKIIAENPEVVATYKAGKENAIMSLVGKVIKESKGSANPQMVIKLLKELLK
ncbi:MAG: hypothetical protein ABH951_01300, partial [Patescibacteria group bacterium]